MKDSKPRCKAQFSQVRVGCATSSTRRAKQHGRRRRYRRDDDDRGAAGGAKETVPKSANCATHVFASKVY